MKHNFEEDIKQTVEQDMMLMEQDIAKYRINYKARYMEQNMNIKQEL